MDGSALEVALALMRMPSMRVALRCRPLPEGVGELIELAAGSPARVAQAAACSHESTANVLEAARFYVREVLLFPGADAYRILGVPPDAADARIKLHHRHLQQWLHPDRDGDGWESVFAARVNTAWAELRSPPRRAAYDARRASIAPASQDDAPQRVLVGDWRPTPTVEDSHWRHWVLPGAGVACCLLLALLVARQAAVPTPEWEPLPGRNDRIELPASTDATVAAVAAAAREPTAPAEVVAGAALPAPLSRPVEATMVSTVRHGDHSVVPVEIAVARDTRQLAAIAVPASITRTPVQRVATDATDPCIDVVGAGCIEDRRMTRRDESQDPRPLRSGSGAIVAAKPRSSAVVGAASAASFALAPRPAKAGEEKFVPTATPHAAIAEAEARPAPAAVSPQRIGLVQHTARDLTAYLAGTTRRAPPIWNTASAQDMAASIRRRLDGTRVRFGAPDWRVAGERASMTSAIEHRGQQGELAVLRAEFTWREGLWLVDRLAMDGAQ
jgi:hypothetical protein